MSKAKAYTRMILERLNKKADTDQIKSNLSSNQKTQATPSDHRDFPHNPRSFFDHFDKNCAVYHEPVVLHRLKPTRRSLATQLEEMQRANRMSEKFQKEKKERLATEPFRVSEFMVEEKKRVDYRMPQIRDKESKDSKSNAMKASQDRHAKVVQGNSYISRYRSLKTLPSKSVVVGETAPPIRRMLVSSSLMRVQRRDSLDRNFHKYQKKRVQPHRELLHRCESYQKYVLGRAF